MSGAVQLGFDGTPYVAGNVVDKMIYILETYPEARESYDLSMVLYWLEFDGLAELVDLYPTLADLAGLPAPDDLDGVSQRPVLQNPATTVKDAAYTQVRRGRFHGFSIRTEKWRYTMWDHGNQGEQLYDMLSDPAETQNQAHDPALASTVAELKRLLEEYAQNTP